MFKFDRKSFFDGYRAKFGPLAQLQVEGLSFLLDKIEADPEWKSLSQVAYFLATVKHETGIVRKGILQTFQPIKELRGREGTKIRRTQDRYWPSGYYGRGFIQITWEDNYKKFGIADDPDKALDPEIAYDIAARGMRKGMFTGRKLADYEGPIGFDYFHARQIVNRMDKADLVAGYAETFEDILTEAAKVDDISTVPPIADKKPIEDQAGTVPPAKAVEVKASEVPFWTRVTSFSIPAGAAAAVGAVFNFVKELPPYAWFALGLIIVAAMVIGYMIYRDSRMDAHERTKIVLNAAADREKNDLRLV